MIVVTHELSVARHVAHSVAVMVDGRIVESVSPESVLTNPRDPSARAFFGLALSREQTNPN